MFRQETKIIRDVYLVSFSFLCIFSAYMAIQNLETSLTAESCSNCYHGSSGSCKNVNTSVCAPKIFYACNLGCPIDFQPCTSKAGSVSIGLLYLACMVTCLFSPKIAGSYGVVPSMRYSSLAYILFCIANYIVATDLENAWVHWGALLPFSLFTGIANSVIWVSVAAYLAQMARRHSFASHESSTATLARFSSIFWLIEELSQILGNFLSSLLLNEFKWAMSGIFAMYIGFALLGSIVLWLLHNDHHTVEVSQPCKQQKVLPLPLNLKTLCAWDRIGTMIEMTKDVYVLVLPKSIMSTRKMYGILPLCFFTGLQQGLAYGDFTAIFVMPSVGQANIGYVMMSYGISYAIACYVCGWLSPRIKSWSIFQIGFVAMSIVFIYLRFAVVEACSNSWASLITMAILLAVGNAAFSVTLTILIGDAFAGQEVVAYSVTKFCQTCAIGISFLSGSFVSIQIRLTVSFVVLVCGMLVFRSVHLQQVYGA